MPERIIEAFTRWPEHIWQAVGFYLLGVVLAIGRILDGHEPITWRLVIGRSISTGGLAMAAGMVLVWVPDLPLFGQIGVAAAMASLGTSGLERAFRRVIKGR